MKLSKFTKCISILLCTLLLCTLLPLQRADAAAEGIQVIVESVTAKEGQQVVVPIKLANVPSGGISAADMTINYDGDKLEYITGAAGSIVTDPNTNIEINNDKKGSVKILFLDYTMEDGYIGKDGVFVNITFKVLGPSTISVVKANFGDKKMNPLNKNLIAGTVTIKNEEPVQPTTPPVTSGLTLTVESISANAGQQVVVPVKLANVPSIGISAADMAITYDASKLEYITGLPGEIITDPDTNFGINKDKEGSIKVLFLDYTMSSGYINKDGVFVNLTFKALDTSTISISKANFGDPSLNPISVKLNGGTVTVNAVDPTQPITPQPTPTPTPIPTQPSSQPGNYTVSYTQSDWGTGATVNITITNKGETAISGWTVSFNYDGNQKITNAWNCTYTQNGKSVLLSGVDYNSVIPAGESVTVGFNISYSGTNAIPANITVK